MKDKSQSPQPPPQPPPQTPQTPQPPPQTPQPPQLPPQTPPQAALITGGGRRIGAAIAHKLAEKGWNLALHSHSSREDAAALAQDLRALGVKVVLLYGDLRDETCCAALIPEAERQLAQALGLLINNAAVFSYDCALSADRATWDLHMETNLRAPFLLAQDFARRLPQEAKGVIINILDQRVLSVTPHFITYTLSKSGLWTLTQSLALALAPRIRVNAVGPGPTLPSSYQDDENFARQCARLPLKHGSTPKEVAEAVCALVALPSVTGQLIALDGGQHLGWSFPPLDSKT